MKESTKKLSTESYKGVRDFYPEEQYVQQYIFDTWKQAVHSFGYEEYNASILENTEIYHAKSGQELVNEQTYTFTDRGDRQVTLRPEMTPSLARMVAAKKRELPFPLRLFSIPNCFRYERPQRGRLREFWQLNVDLLTKKPSIRYDVEILQLVARIMKGFGATDLDYTIHINSRAFLEKLYTDYYGLTGEYALAFQKLTDKRNKISGDEFIAEYYNICDEAGIDEVKDLIDIREELDLETLRAIPSIKESLDMVTNTIELCKNAGITNIIFDENTVRGLDYYTGLVFEVFDTDTKNNRALFGGGRYDNLIDIFEGATDEATISGIGFGIGDVPMLNFLESRDLIPAYASETDILVAVLDEDENTLNYADEVAQTLRDDNKKVAVLYTSRKSGDIVTYAKKLSVKNIVMIGENEVKNKEYTVKEI
ncbi:MAG: histidine--tRNA ligase [Patescibacteria group bacterium]